LRHLVNHTTIFVLCLFPALSPRHANYRFRAFSIRGGLTATSKLAFLYFIYSRRPHRDKQTSVLVLYLFAASSPRQANRRFRALSIRGGFTSTIRTAFWWFDVSCVVHAHDNPDFLCLAIS